MTAAALRFLAHCFEIILPVSLSTSAGRRRRIFIFSLPCSFSLFVAVRKLCLFSLSSPLSARLSFHMPLSLFLSSKSRELPRHRFP